MPLIRWEPAREVASLQGEINRLFSAFTDTPADSGVMRRWVPAMDLVETDDAFLLKADLPGVAESDMKIEVEDNVLTVAGERRAEHEARKDGYVRVERAAGRFSRSITLPDGVEPDQIAASSDNGVLEVRIPKPPERKPHTIQVGAGRPADIEGSARDDKGELGKRQESGS